MFTLEHKLRDTKIITAEDIEILRGHIYSKNPELSESAKTKIISKAIIKVFDREYYWLEKSERLQARKTLLMALIEDGKDDVNYFDAVEAAYSIASHSEKESEFEKWLEEALDESYSFDSVCHIFSRKYKLKKIAVKYKYAVIGVLLTFIYLIYYFMPHFTSDFIVVKDVPMNSYIIAEDEFYREQLYLDYKQRYFPYKIYDYEHLKNYFKALESKLIEGENFKIIVDTARQYNLDPLLLFAIIGQEQSFVPSTTTYANQIINNPYNVFNSWEYYNTDLKDSTEIASHLLDRIISECPIDEDIFEWMNMTYAEDDRWSEGVRRIYYRLNQYVETY
jgi:putative ABC transport system permease protein